MPASLEQRTTRTALVKILCARLIVTVRTVREGTLVEGHCDEVLRASYKIYAAGLDVAHMSVTGEMLTVTCDS